MLSPLHIDQWIAAHKDWTRGGYRSRIQAVKRALNYAVERKMLAESPLKGYKVPRPATGPASRFLSRYWPN